MPVVRNHPAQDDNIASVDKRVFRRDHKKAFWQTLLNDERSSLEQRYKIDQS